MTMFSVDLIPETSGRNLGSEDKRWDIKARNINLTGALTGSGLQNFVISNPTPDTDTLFITSDTGTGGMLERLRISNISGSARTITKLMNGRLNSGSPFNEEGGANPFNFFSGTDDTDSLVSWYKQGSQSDKALEIDSHGIINSYAPNYAGRVLQVLNWGDAQTLFHIGTTGGLRWGPGGSVTPDVGLERQQQGALQVNNAAGGYGNLFVNQLLSQVATGTPPLSVNSSTKVPNLNADLLDGYDWGSPPPGFGATNPSSGQFTSLLVSGQVTINTAPSIAPLVVQSITPVENLTVRRTENCIHEGIINENGNAIKSVKQVTGSIAPGARAIVHIVWPFAMLTPNYTVSLSIFDSLNPTTLGLRIERITAQETTNIDVQVRNESTTEARNGVVHVMAFRTS